MTLKSGQSSTSAERAIAEIYRSEWGRLLSVLVARSRRLDLAEDALSEAFARASARWPADGIPTNPSGWLYTTAWRQVIGALRSEAIHGRKAQLLAIRPDWVPPDTSDGFGEITDDRLALILLCCHPAVHREARSALALRLVIGTSTAEIARLFLVSTATMAARITRAKKKIVAAGIPLSLPVDDELRSRLEDVCRTVYLAFTAGYTPGEGADLLRTELAGEAVELAAILHRLVPESRQVQALFGLLVLQHGRRDARVRNGQLVTLGEQDRSRWRDRELQLGVTLINGLAPAKGYAEELRLQGLIASEHATATTAAATNWAQIATHYATLEALTGSAVVRLNRAVAVAEAVGAREGLVLLARLDGVLVNNHRLHAVRAELLQRAGDFGAAAVSYRAALELCNNDIERQHLSSQLAVAESMTH